MRKCCLGIVLASVLVLLSAQPRVGAGLMREPVRARTLLLQLRLR
jgi:hypothetical protein